MKEAVTVQRKKAGLFSKIYKHRLIYLLILPSVALFFIFSYVPMAGILMAFKDYRVGLGFMGIFTSPDVGFAHFERLFTSSYFWKVFANTLIISLYKLVIVYPAPILLALLLNEVKNIVFKRIVQTVTYLPNFLSTVIVTGLVLAVVSPTYGLLNAVMGKLGAEPVHFLGNQQYFIAILIIVEMWKTMGFNSVVYLAGITSIDAQLYEASELDGANRFQQAVHITIPGIMNIIILLYILSMGQILNAGFEQIFLLYSPPVYGVADIIDTFTYREGLVNQQYGYSTAVGLFKSVIGLALIIITNQLAKKYKQQGIW